MFLSGSRHDQVFADISRHVADKTVTLIDFVVRGAAVPGESHPTCVHDHRAAFGLVTDHSGQHRNGDLVRRADADPGHDQILENIHAHPNFGDA